MSRFSFAMTGLTAILAVGALSAGALAGAVRMEASAPLPNGQYQRLAVNLTYEDADLSSADGAASLYQRIEAASHNVCGDKDAKYVTHDLEAKFAACRKQAISHTVASLNAPTLNTVAAAAH